MHVQHKYSAIKGFPEVLLWSSHQTWKDVNFHCSKAVPVTLVMDHLLWMVQKQVKILL